MEKKFLFSSWPKGTSSQDCVTRDMSQPVTDQFGRTNLLHAVVMVSFCQQNYIHVQVTRC